MDETADAQPLILTLRFDPQTFAVLDGLRRAHFPPARNVLSAHLTLFHKLPDDDPKRILDAMQSAAPSQTFAVTFTRLRSLGRGVALEAIAPALSTLRAVLAESFRDHLTPQDAQPFRPHVTIQNKVDAAQARALLQRLSDDFTPWSGTATGLLLWRYLGGPWALEAEASFAA